ncbi:nitroreductase [bacterium]|nr:nitroreductase [bacterium]
MEKQESVFNLIQKRRSRRSYTGEPLTEEQIRIFKNFFMENQRGPFLNKVRFSIVSQQGYSGTPVKLSTYGMIKGAVQFIAGAVYNDYLCYEDFGYAMEKNILQATRMDLGTCWLGASFRKNRFAAAVNLRHNEVIPAISPVGKSVKDLTLRESAIRFFAASKKRRTWKELFFTSDNKMPITPEAAGSYADALEAVRLGPSASNKQPWRIVKDASKNQFDFFLKPSKQYGDPDNKFQLQHIDIGIAMCHFELVSAEAGIKGKWQILEDREKIFPEALYIVSWIQTN